PNTLLATGNKSYRNGSLIEWKNIFEDTTDIDIIKGIHITVSSVIDETQERLEGVRDQNIDFVDPEIGQMAYYAAQAGIGYSYLHIISDNLTFKYDEHLGNEREKKILLKRDLLLDKISDILLSTIEKL
ncbi:MAG TPA: hypothetical protein PKC14_04975, partial [Candidatus Absconditabacterales bacterium]|nr:hypothetical protein [Candidatus Absconditabacterales bacterium]